MPVLHNSSAMEGGNETVSKFVIPRLERWEIQKSVGSFLVLDSES